MKPLKVTASLYNGFVAMDEWSPMLDGILAYWLLRLKDPDGFLTSQGRSDLMLPVEGLPLQRMEHHDVWWWACSFPLYQLHQQHKTYFHRRFDEQYERFMPDGVKTVLTSAGPYKAYRKSMIFRVTQAVEWHCVGDEAAIRDLLRHCHHIGAKPSQGYGRVKEWTIAPGNEEIALFRRPLPKAYAEQHQIEGPLMQWGIRPPGRIAANQTLCVMPESWA